MKQRIWRTSYGLWFVLVVAVELSYSWGVAIELSLILTGIAEVAAIMLFATHEHEYFPSRVLGFVAQWILLLSSSFLLRRIELSQEVKMVLAAIAVGVIIGLIIYVLRLRKRQYARNS